MAANVVIPSCLTCRHFRITFPTGYCDTCAEPGSVSCDKDCKAFSTYATGDTMSLISAAEQCGEYELHSSLSVLSQLENS